MDLSHQGGRKTLAGKMMKEAAAILFHPLALIGLRESKVQPGARRFAHASLPRAEGMHQPRKFAQPSQFDPAETPSPHHFGSLRRQSLNIAQYAGQPA